ncbi:LysR family transcriptional regulator [Porticoccaceae bacterium]|nr:LysR family transcriptional regulator [Porticoccaceae bacterium]
MLKDFDWESLRFFLALVRCATPGAAGSMLHVDHNTVRRRVALLEHELDTKLLVKRSGKYSLTSEGAVLMRAAEEIERLASTASKEIAGKDFEVSGTVRLAAPDGIATFFLAPRLAAIRDAFPRLNVELTVPHRQSRLSKREADIAITIDRPLEKRVVAKKLVDVTLRLFASRSYLSSAPVIRTRRDLGRHRFVSGVDEFDFGSALSSILSELGSAFEPTIACSSIVAQLKATASGGGLCCLANFIAGTEKDLVCILPEELSFKREVWIATHRDLESLARVRAVQKVIEQSFTESMAIFE